MQVRDNTANGAMSIRHLVANVSASGAKAPSEAQLSEARKTASQQRFLVNTLVRTVMRSDRDPRRIALLESTLDNAVEKPTFVTILADMFEGVNNGTNADAVAELLEKQLKLKPKTYIATLVAIANATGDTSTVGRQLLSKKLGSSPAAVAKDLPSHVTLALLKTTRSDATLANAGKTIANEQGLPFPLSKPPSGAEAANRLQDSLSLSRLIQDLGPACVSSTEDANALLSLLPKTISPLTVAQCIAFFASPSLMGPSDSVTYTSLKMSLGLSGGAASGSNSSPQAVANLVAALKGKYPSLDWNEVLRAMDHPSCKVERFTIIATAFKKGANQAIPVSQFLGRWSNRQLQGHALRFALTNPDLTNRDLPDTVTLPEKFGGEGLWRNLNFVDAMVNAAIVDKECSTELSKAIAQFPALLFTALLTMPPAYGLRNVLLAEELVQQQGADFISGEVVDYLREQKRTEMLITVLSTVAAQQGEVAADAAPAPTKRMMEVVGIISKFHLGEVAVKSATSAKLLVYLAITGDRALSGSWLADALNESNKRGPLFPTNRLAVALAVIEAADELHGNEDHSASVATALGHLVGQTKLLQTYTGIGTAARQLQTSAGGGDATSFPEVIQTRAKQFLQKAYGEQQPTSDNIDQLELWSKSPDPKNQQTFQCIVQILFDETRCLTEYPFKALNNAALLFGALVSRNLLSAKKNEMALKITLAMLLKPTDAKMLEYGIVALDNFKNRLAEWPAFGKQLKEVQDLDMRIPGIMAIVNNSLTGGVRILDPACMPVAKSSGTSTGTGQNLGLHQHDIRVLLDDSDTAKPPSVMQERINFLVGNTDPSNLDENAAELGTLVTPEFYQYFADYLVVKRVSLEPNFHRMYLQLVERLGAPDLEMKIRSSSVIAVKRLLGSDKIRTNSSERSLLKNLGSWLGNFTLARNKPVYARHLDFTELIFHGLEEGKLIAVVPFIAKVLEGAANSTVFRPQNPWIMGTLSALMEMYRLPDLKITLRFEVEVLCKNLGITVPEVLEYMAKYPRPHRVPSMLDLRNAMKDITESTDFRFDENAAQADDAPKKKLQADAVPYKPRQQAASPTVGNDLTPVVISAETVRAGQEAAGVPAANRAQYMQVLALSLERGIKELLAVVERCARVATATTRDIVMKDFCRDPDDFRMRRAALMMARSLSTSLTLATVNEQLQQVLRKVLLPIAQRLAGDNEADQAVVIQRIAQNNLDLCTQALEYQAALTASEMIEKAMEPIIAERMRAMAKNEFPVVPQDQMRLTNFLSMLPEAIRPVHQLGQQQLNVYEGFASHSNAIEQVNRLIAQIEEAATKHYLQIPPVDQNSILSLTNVAFTETNQSEHHVLIKQKLVETSQLINDRSAVPLVALIFPRLMKLCDMLRSIESRPPTREYCVTLLLNEVCLFVLQSAREKGQGKAVQELTKLYLKHDRRWYNRDIATNFIRLSVIDIADFDRELAAALNNSSDPNHRVVVEFAGHVVQKCLIDDKLATAKDLRGTLDTLERIASASRRNTPGEGQEQRPAAAPGTANRVRIASTMHTSEQRTEVEKLFQEWIAIAQRKPEAEQEGQPTTKQMAMAFLAKLQQVGMLRPDGMLDTFFGVQVECMVEDFATIAARVETGLHVEPPARPQDAPKSRIPETNGLLAHVDAFSDLMVLLVRCCGWSGKEGQAAQQPSTHNAEMALISKILSVVGKVLTHNHDSIATPPQNQPPLPEGFELQTTFVQQPYVRFFSNSIIAFLTGQAFEISDEAPFVTVFLSSLHQLNPNRVTGFAFGWLELVCHRVLVSKALKNKSTWPLYFKLVADALKFIDGSAKNAEIDNHMLLFFKSVLKLMLVLLHDFSEFLLMYHQPLCDVIPTCCVQLRNVVLSAFPKTTKLPDPFQDNLKIDRLPEMAMPPLVAESTKEAFDGSPIALEQLQTYCRSKTPSDFPEQVFKALNTRPLSVQLLNATVLFAGMTYLETTSQKVEERFYEAPVMDLFIHLAKKLDTEGRYHLLNSMANQLRFPNNHTHFFSCVLLYMFSYSTWGSPKLQDIVQEQITRTIVERLIISRPHPWGLLITFIELAKNPKYRLWERPFIRCTPEIERMFETMGKTLQGGGNAGTSTTAPAPAAPAAGGNANGAVSAPTPPQSN